MSSPTDVPKGLLCGHPVQEARTSGYKLTCGVCGSFWDLVSWRKAQGAPTYSDAYPEDRKHFDPNVGRLKVQSLEHWLDQLSLSPANAVVCEVGFGAGYTLAYLNARAQCTFGIESVDKNLKNAEGLGVPADKLLLAEKLPEKLGAPVTLWVFQDSLEHILDPSEFMDWVTRNSAPHAQLLLVMPRADSFSERLLGRLWIHRIPEHVFHWSRAGVLELLARSGFKLEAQFAPRKCISLRMGALHFLNMFGLLEVPFFKACAGLVPELKIRMNFGEMGLLLERG